MDIPINVEVFCTDGVCGRTTRVIVRPQTEEVTEVVVKADVSPYQEVMIPISAVTESTPDSVNICYAKAELADLQLFQVTEYINVNVSSPGGGSYYMASSAYPVTQAVPLVHEAISFDELAVHQGTAVEATDGRVGQVDEFLMDPVTERITHLILREGHLWGQKDVTIPVSEIERIEEDTVYLTLDKAAVEALPSIPVRRSWL